MKCRSAPLPARAASWHRPAAARIAQEVGLTMSWRDEVWENGYIVAQAFVRREGHLPQGRGGAVRPDLPAGEARHGLACPRPYDRLLGGVPCW